MGGNNSRAVYGMRLVTQIRRYVLGGATEYIGPGPRGDGIVDVKDVKVLAKYVVFGHARH